MKQNDNRATSDPATQKAKVNSIATTDAIITPGAEHDKTVGDAKPDYRITDEEYKKAVRARVEKADFLDKYFTCIGETSPLIERLELDMDSMPSFNLTQLSIAHDRAAAIVRWMHEKGVHEKCGLTIWLAYIYAIAHYQGKKEIKFVPRAAVAKATGNQ